MDGFIARDADGDVLELCEASDYAQREYGAVVAVDGGAMYLDRHQAEALRDWLTQVLAS